MHRKKFDISKMLKLNDPLRLEDISPEYIWGKLAINKANIVVEIGAGTAFFSIAFLQLSKAYKSYACDISQVMFNWMKENVVPKYSNIIPVKSEEEKVPLNDGIADLVFMVNLHHELYNPLETLHESYRILKPGGKLFIIDWKKESPRGPLVESRYLPEQVAKQLVGSGFENVEFFTELPKHFLVIGEKS